jgi:hypothetical protein
MQQTSHCFTRCRRWLETSRSTTTLLLTSFSLDSLTDIGALLGIGGNGALTSFSLDSLTDIGGDLRIDDNASLCQPQVDALVDAMTALGWPGTADITDDDC